MPIYHGFARASFPSPTEFGTAFKVAEWTVARRAVITKRRDSMAQDSADCVLGIGEHTTTRDLAMKSWGSSSGKARESPVYLYIFLTSENATAGLRASSLSKHPLQLDGRVIITGI